MPAVSYGPTKSTGLKIMWKIFPSQTFPSRVILADVKIRWGPESGGEMYWWGRSRAAVGELGATDRVFLANGGWLEFDRGIGGALPLLRFEPKTAIMAATAAKWISG